MGCSGRRRCRRQHGQTNPRRDKPPGGRRRHGGLGHGWSCELLSAVSCATVKGRYGRLGHGWSCECLLRSGRRSWRWWCLSLADRPSRRECDGGLGPDCSRWAASHGAGWQLALGPQLGLARPRDKAEVARRRKHHPADQKQAQGGQHGRPADSCRAPVAGKKICSQTVPDSLSLCHGQLLQRLSRTHQSGERPQLPVLR